MAEEQLRSISGLKFEICCPFVLIHVSSDVQIHLNKDLVWGHGQELWGMLSKLGAILSTI